MDQQHTVIQFDDGSETIRLFNTDGPQIRWYPNDVNFIDRLSRFNEWIVEFSKRLQEIKGLRSVEVDEKDGTVVSASEQYVEGTIENMSTELCQKLDETFAASISALAFKNVSPLSPTKQGTFVYENLLNAIMPRIEKSFEGFAGAREKYTSRFAAASAIKGINT